MITARQIESVRRLGLVERAPDGTEKVRVSLHLTAPLPAPTYGMLQNQVKSWVSRMRVDVLNYGGSVLDETISVTGKSVEAMAPVAQLSQLSNFMQSRGVDVDLVKAEDVTL